MNKIILFFALSLICLMFYQISIFSSKSLFTILLFLHMFIYIFLLSTFYLGLISLGYFLIYIFMSSLNLFIMFKLLQNV